MLTVLIADDEKKVCQLIQGLVPWASMHLQVVGMAHDGLSALEMLKAFRPDIMITDIRMPGIDGISLIREAKAILPDLRCVIISGYRHFDYAHNAIKYGVEDYLLKPLQKREIIDTLEKLCLRRDPPPQAGDYLRTQAFLSACLQGASGETMTKESVRSRYGIELPEDCLFYALMVKPDLEGVPAGEPVRRIASERIMDRCRAALSPLLLDSKMALLPEGIAALLCVSRDEKEVRGTCLTISQKEKDLHDTLHTIRERAELMRDVFPTLRVSIGVSAASERFSDIPELFEQCYAALETRLLHGEGALFIGKPEPREALFIRSVLRADTLRSLLTSLSSLQAEVYAEALHSSFGQLHAASGNPPQLRVLLKEMIRLHFEQLPHGATLREMEEMIARFSDRWNAAVLLSDVEEAFVSLLKRHFLDMDSARRQIEQMPLRRAKAYIREHYQKPLTLEEVSGVAGFNPAYFSTLFKKETGEKFTDYLSSVRIQAAQKLLMSSDFSILMVAEKTGYGDVKYFSKQFKKAMGLSPQEYRKLYG